MGEVPVCCRGVRCGEARLREEGGRLEIRAELPDPRDGLYRGVLVCRQGELSLGVLHAENGNLVLRRRPEKSELARLGEPVCVQIGCSFAFGTAAVWEKTVHPSTLLQDTFLCARLERCACAWWRKEQGRLVIALPVGQQEPFPLETMFCFAKVARVEGEVCAVYTFDAAQQPVMPSMAQSAK